MPLHQIERERYRAVTLFRNSVTARSCINRIACNSHSDNKKPIPGTHVDNKMCDCRPLHSVISGSICVLNSLQNSYPGKGGSPASQRLITITISLG
eukprot:SAG25_NODE_186_length_12406_cov_7.083530_1_plen_96_part_00